MERAGRERESKDRSVRGTKRHKAERKESRQRDIIERFKLFVIFDLNGRRASNPYFSVSTKRSS